MKYLLTLLLLLSGTVFAGDSGIYEDKSAPGEGIILQRNKDIIVFYFFTFGGNDCDEYPVTIIGPVPFMGCGEQSGRWFYAANEYNDKNQESSGFIYTAKGTNWPDGVPSTEDPFINEVSESFIVGIYILRRHDEGWRLFIQRFGSVLHEDDHIFDRVFNFTSPVFYVSEPVAEPK